MAAVGRREHADLDTAVSLALALAAADAHVRIPIDPALDSLNVAAAAAITLYRLGGGSLSGSG